MKHFLCGALCASVVIGSVGWGISVWNRAPRVSVNDFLTVYLGEPRKDAAAAVPKGFDDFPMKVLVTRIEPDGTVAFEGSRKVTSGNDSWTRSLRGKVGRADIHPGGIVFSSRIFALEVEKTETHPEIDP